MNFSPLRLLFGFLFIAFFAVVGSVQTTKADDTPTVEGEWDVVIPPNQEDMNTPINNPIGHRIKIYREGSKYHIPSDTWAGDDSAFGSSSRITHREPYTFERLKSVMSSSVPASVLGELAEKDMVDTLTYELAGDGNTLVVSSSSPYVTFDRSSGKLGSYRVDDDYYKTTYKRISGPVDKESSVPIVDTAQVESRGEFYFLTKDGRKVNGKEASKIPLEEGIKVVTGNDGHIKMILPDNTIFTVGPNSDLVIDKFVYDADKTPGQIMATMTKGAFRWVTGKAARHDPAKMKVILPVGDLGIRGTDFEITVAPNGSGSVVLYFGQLEITEKKTGFIFVLNAGEKITFTADGSFSRPMKVQ